MNNRIILVTGATDGIGKVAAKTFAAHGATVILHGRNIKKLETVYDEIIAAGHPTPAIAPLELITANPDQYLELVTAIDKEFGRLDGLLHNAAILGTLTPIEHYNIEQWYKVIQVNLHAPFILTQKLLPLLKKSERANLVFTSSGVGRKGQAYWGAYGVSKFAIEGLSQILKEELENTHITVHCIDPGAVATKMLAKAYPARNLDGYPTPEDLMPRYLEIML